MSATPASKSREKPRDPDTLVALNIADLNEMARRRLPKGIFEYIERGTEDEVSLRNNRATVERIKLQLRASEIFHEEIDRVLALIGCRSVAALNSDYLAIV